MELIRKYRPEGLDVEISEGNIKKIMVIRGMPKIGIIVKILGEGRKVLWSPEEYESHLDDTEQQFIDRLIEVY